MVGTFLDIGFGVIIAVAVIVGLAAGFTRQFSRPICGLIAIFGAIGIATIIYNVLSPLAFYGAMEQKVIAWFGSAFYKQEVSDAEGLAAVISGSYLRILTSSSELIWNNMVNMDVTTLGAHFGKLVTRIITEFVLWLAFYLAIKYLLIGIKYLMGKISRVVVFKSIDRILGLVWSLALTYIVVVSIVMTTEELVLVKFFPSIGETVANYMSQTAMVKFFHNTNVVGSFVADLLSSSLLPNL